MQRQAMVEKPAKQRLTIAVACACLALVVAALFSQRHAVGVEGAADAKASGGGMRFREGTQLTDVLGHFRMTGDRATFYPLSSQGGYAGLENLNLERVKLMISDSSDPLTWQISGTITEYRGSNYILLNKAILKSQAEVADEANPQRKGRNSSQPAGKTRL